MIWRRQQASITDGVLFYLHNTSSLGRWCGLCKTTLDLWGHFHACYHRKYECLSACVREGTSPGYWQLHTHTHTHTPLAYSTWGDTHTHTQAQTQVPVLCSLVTVNCGGVLKAKLWHIKHTAAEASQSSVGSVHVCVFMCAFVCVCVCVCGYRVCCRLTTELVSRVAKPSRGASGSS